MKTCISVLVLALFACLCFAENPGLVATVRLPIVEKVRDRYFESVFGSFGHMNLPDISEGDIKVSNIRVDMSNSSPQNLKVTFIPEKNAIGVEIDQTDLKVNVDYHYKKLIVSVNGDAQITGTIGGIGMSLALSSLGESSYFIPQVSTEDFFLNMDTGAFKLDIHCNYCPGEVEKLIASFLKDKLINEVKSQIQSQVPSQVNSIGNEMLKTNFPRAFTLYNDINIATALTGDILVKQDHLEVPLDATMFLSSKGYSRSSSTPDMPRYNPLDPGEIMMFFNPYLVSTLADTLNQGVQSYSLSIMGIDYSVALDPAAGQTSLGLEEGDFSITATPTVTATKFGLGIQIGATAKLNPQITNGDAQNMFFVTPSIKGLSLNSLKVFYKDTPYDLSFALDYLNEVIQGLLNVFVIPTIPVAKLEILPLHVTNTELDFHKDYSEFGILFDFGRH